MVMAAAHGDAAQRQQAASERGRATSACAGRYGASCGGERSRGRAKSTGRFAEPAGWVYLTSPDGAEARQVEHTVHLIGVTIIKYKVTKCHLASRMTGPMQQRTFAGGGATRKGNVSSRMTCGGSSGRAGSNPRHQCQPSQNAQYSMSQGTCSNHARSLRRLRSSCGRRPALRRSALVLARHP